MGDKQSTAPDSLTRAGSMRRVSRPLQSPIGPRTLTRSATLPHTGTHANGSTSTNISPSPALPPIPQGSHSSRKHSTNHNARMSPPALSPCIEEPSPISDDVTMPSLLPNIKSDISAKSIPKASRVSILPLQPLLFEQTTLPWKGLPLEAAVWTFPSQDLQEIVSRVIRSSSKENFIRLLSLELLDHTLPNQVESLNSEKMVTQAKYRFLTQRRQMLLQALSSACYTPPKDSTISELVVQLSEVSNSCDQTLSELLLISDKLGQINKLLESHSASALAIALRKLNKSYGRRTEELIIAKDKIVGLEAALSDAWKEAERLAKDLNEREQEASEAAEALAALGPPDSFRGSAYTIDAIDDDIEEEDEGGEEDEDLTTKFGMDTTSLVDEETGIIRRAEVVSLLAHSRTITGDIVSSPIDSVVPIQMLVDATGSATVLTRTNGTQDDDVPTTPDASTLLDDLYTTAQSIPTTTTTSTTTIITPLKTKTMPKNTSKHTPPPLPLLITPPLPPPPPTPPTTTNKDEGDTTSIKSGRTTKSTKSTRNRDHLADVASARRRSLRAVHESLRLPPSASPSPSPHSRSRSPATGALEGGGEATIPDLPTSLHLLHTHQHHHRGSSTGGLGAGAGGRTRPTSMVSSLYNPHTSFINFDMDSPTEQNVAGGGAPLLQGLGAALGFNRLRVMSPAPSSRSILSSSSGGGGSSGGFRSPGVTVDDIHVTPSPSPGLDSREFPRITTPTRGIRGTVDDVVVVQRHGKMSSIGGTSTSTTTTTTPATATSAPKNSNTIPSIWIHADTPPPTKSPSERVHNLLQHHQQSRTKTSSSYAKLKSFTKRYSFGVGSGSGEGGGRRIPLFNRAVPPPVAPSERQGVSRLPPQLPSPITE